MLTYPKEFVEEVAAEYGDRPDVVFLARENRLTLGRLLAEGASLRMSPEEIVSAFGDGSQGEVLDDAAAAVRRRKLHAEWMRIVCREISCAKDRASSSRWVKTRTFRFRNARPQSEGLAPGGM